MPSKLKICTSFSGLSRKTFRNYIVFLLKTLPWSLFCSGYWPLIWTGRTGLFLVSQILKKISFYDTICYIYLRQMKFEHLICIWLRLLLHYYHVKFDNENTIFENFTSTALAHRKQAWAHSSESSVEMGKYAHCTLIATAMNVHLESTINYNLAILFWTLWWVGAQGA